MSDYTLPPLHPLYVHEKDMERVKQWGQHCAEAARAPLLARIAELEDLLRFVERWANHHGAKPSCTAKEALSVIQHHPSITAITRSYADGKVPDTFDPYARIAELESKLQLERHSLLWACNVYMVPDEAEGADRAQRAVVAASRVRESVSKSLDLRRKKESGDA